ncbi:MAG: DEAD/DEAH box helicase-like protein, partial [Candidatus Berkelbacteria bacterium Licking1014_85]
MGYSNFKKNSSRRFNDTRRCFVNPGLRIDVNRFINRAQNIENEETFTPKHQFVDFAIDSKLKQNILSKKYTTPTPIQDQVIPLVLNNRDIIGIANTGTGKTAAFLIPLINKIILNRQQKIIIMVPTRELAQQTQAELISFSRDLGIKSALCIGGANIRVQIRDLRNNPSFVIGTPGRLKDLIERKVLYLGNFHTVVLDEADRMLDMGFINDMKAILSLMPHPKQTLLFSATISAQIEQITRRFQNNPLKISVKTRETLANVDQNIIRVNHQGRKIDVLHDLLIKPGFEKVLVFG